MCDMNRFCGKCAL